MSLADAIPDFVARRAARQAARAADRAARDAFIVPQFALLSADFEALLAAALGLDGRVRTTVTTVVVPVQGRTFPALSTRVVTVRSTIDPTPKTISFTPGLDFREPDQFGRYTCEIDFDVAPRPARRDAVARILVERGILMSGRTVGTLLFPADDGATPLTARHLENAFTAWWLR